ncbi:PREDICTED: probable S-adenosylmethionine-dependent methyltransferase At5g38780 [Camelina sativa]|uniref:Probable S-adenosylmethionine-dependent methyltransferase At5g38780 n=1 Tax=Camelina sativa TaxID=90675 RepID=A0ABM0UGW7_CAMSA|nr:PREDICTED: probable S-adenosylmethionine-dependent methyltransferase At5g38780 [Camelina sativa]
MSTSSQSYPMSGGDDQHSYIHNSSYQKAVIDGVEEKARQYILEKIDLLNLNPDLSTFTIADFGCSIGPNTFHAVQNIIDIVKLKHLKESQGISTHVPLEFQVCFNDLPNNDFNTLFRTLPPSFEQKYFSVGVPGSFYGQVLPRNSIHIGHTSYTTHWLSKVPENVCDKKSPAWNKNYIHCNNLLEEVTEAYKVQFTKDMSVFLKARAEELVPGGLMIALGECFPDDVAMYETWSGIVLDTIGDCLLDMATSGVLTHEQIELFSMPVYFPQYSELERAIEQNGSFTIEMMETTRHPLEAKQLTNDFVTSMFRAFLSTMIEKHFGYTVVDQLFNQLAKKLSKHPLDFEKCKKNMVYYIVLKRNEH